MGFRCFLRWIIPCHTFASIYFYVLGHKDGPRSSSISSSSGYLRYGCWLFLCFCIIGFNLEGTNTSGKQCHNHSDGYYLVHIVNSRLLVIYNKTAEKQSPSIFSKFPKSIPLLLLINLVHL